MEKQRAAAISAERETAQVLQTARAARGHLPPVDGGGGGGGINPAVEEHRLRRAEASGLVLQHDRALDRPGTVTSGLADEIAASLPLATTDTPIYAPPPVVDGQEFMVCHYAHVGLTPQAAGPRLRLCGAYTDEDKASAHAATVDAACRCTKSIPVPRYAWQVIAKHGHAMADTEYLDAHIERVLSLHAEADAEADAQFDQCSARAARRRTQFHSSRSDTSDTHHERSPAPAKDSPARTANQNDPMAHVDRARRRRARSRRMDQAAASRAEAIVAAARRQGPGYMRAVDFPRACEVRRQQWAAIMVLDDISCDFEQDKQPLYCWLGAFDSDGECREWIDKHAPHAGSTADMFAVAMYEWLKPCRLLVHLAEHPDAVETSCADPTKRRLLQKDGATRAFETSYASAIDATRQADRERGNDVSLVQPPVMVSEGTFQDAARASDEQEHQLNAPCSTNDSDTHPNSDMGLRMSNGSCGDNVGPNSDSVRQKATRLCRTRKPKHNRSDSNSNNNDSNRRRHTDAIQSRRTASATAGENDGKAVAVMIQNAARKY